MLATRQTLVGLHLFNALSAAGAGIALFAGGLGVSTSLLRHTPFDSFVVPAIVLTAVVGGSATIGATALLAHRRQALVTSGAAGAIMVGWILGEAIVVEGFSWLQGLYVLTGSIVAVASIRPARAVTDLQSPGRYQRTRDDQGALR